MKIKCNYCSTLYDDSYSSWDNDWIQVGIVTDKLY